MSLIKNKKEEDVNLPLFCCRLYSLHQYITDTD